jgi:hypothetical protein
LFPTLPVKVVVLPESEAVKAEIETVMARMVVGELPVVPTRVAAPVLRSMV